MTTMEKKKTKGKSETGRKPRFSTNPSQELKKVTWPNRDTLVKSTTLIVIMVLFFAIIEVNVFPSIYSITK